VPSAFFFSRGRLCRVLIYARRVFFSPSLSSSSSSTSCSSSSFLNEYFYSSARRRRAYSAKTRFSHSRCVSDDAYHDIYIRNTHRTRLLPNSNNTGRRSDAPLCVGIYIYMYIVYIIFHIIYRLCTRPR